MKENSTRLSGVHKDQAMSVDVAIETFLVPISSEPATNEEMYKRLHYYVAGLATTASSQLYEALLDLRRTAPGINNILLRQTAFKQFSNQEFSAAVKEVMCLWLHLEAVAQGGEDMPGWLLNFFQLSFGAADYTVPVPRANEVMAAYKSCQDVASFCYEGAIRVCMSLGFGENSLDFAPAINPVLLQTSSLRSQCLKSALMLPTQELGFQMP